jgi:hypothetical protein
MRVKGIMDSKTLRRLQRFRAEAIPANAIRNQGAPGVLAAARPFLRRVSLARFRTRSRATFEAHLDAVTERLKRKFPPKAQNWGAARKTVNLFLRDCTYDHHLRACYGLAVIEPWLEVPLDSYVANTLGKHKRYELPSRWPGLKELTPEESAQYQDVAQRLADRKGIYRVHLDLYWWRMR